MKKITLLFLLLSLILNIGNLYSAWTEPGITNNSEQAMPTDINTNKKEQENIPEEVTEEEKQEPVSFINVSLKSNKIALEWEDSTSDMYNIYRTTSKISNQNLIKASTLLGTVNKGIQIYIDKNIPNNGDYYYAIINVNDSKENIILIPDSNITTIPIAFTKPKPTAPEKPKVEKKEEPTPKKVVQKPKTVKKKIKKEPKKKIVVNYNLMLNNTIKKYFLKKNYKKTIIELNKITKAGTSNKTRMKAKLFLGRTYYELGNYNKALKLFTESKEVYSDESDFWIRKTIKNIK